MADISGTTLEIRITEIDTGKWRWLLCAVEGLDPSGRERHRAAWSGKATSADRAFQAAMAHRETVLVEAEG